MSRPNQKLIEQMSTLGYYTVPHVSKHLKVHQTTLRNWSTSGEIKSLRQGSIHYLNLEDAREGDGLNPSPLAIAWGPNVPANGSHGKEP